MKGLLSQNNFKVIVEVLKVGDSATIILQKGAENWFQVDDYEQDKKDFFGDGNMLVEPIFYAWSWIYDFQYLDFLDKKYLNDKEWLELLYGGDKPHAKWPTSDHRLLRPQLPRHDEQVSNA